MYGAIQKLDEKFEQLQAKVTNVQPIQLTPELFQKVNSAIPISPWSFRHNDSLAHVHSLSSRIYTYYYTS